LTGSHYITASCVITDGCVRKDESVLFEQQPGMPGFLVAAYKQLVFSYPRFYKMDNLARLGWLASEILLNGTFDRAAYQPEDIGVVLANTNSSLDDDLKYLESMADMASPSLFVYTLPNVVIGEICIRNNFKGEQAFYILDKFESAFITRQVEYLLTQNILKCCICGWVDVLGEEYSAKLLLVEKIKHGDAIRFSEQSIDKIFGTAK
jgi:hypothetical protein